MSSSARNSAMARHPALNRMPRDFIKTGSAPSFFPDNAADNNQIIPNSNANILAYC